MESKDELIKMLRKENRKLKKENEYFKSPIFMWDICQAIKGEYSILLNPPPLTFNTTKNQKACSFKININDIICILSSGKLKLVYFIEQQSSSTGIRHVSDKLDYTGSLSNFCKEFDRPSIHLCQVSRSAIINIFHYYLDGNQLRLKDPKTRKHDKCDNISIGKDYVTEFLNRKSAIRDITSFLKIDFRGKFSPLNDLHDSFVQ